MTATPDATRLTLSRPVATAIAARPTITGGRSTHENLNRIAAPRAAPVAMTRPHDGATSHRQESHAVPANPNAAGRSVVTRRAWARSVGQVTARASAIRPAGGP